MYSFRFKGSPLTVPGYTATLRAHLDKVQFKWSSEGLVVQTELRQSPDGAQTEPRWSPEELRQSPDRIQTEFS